jgi:hypothetical protein
MMPRIEPRMSEARMEAVTTTFVASGEPKGVRDLGRLLENLNNPASTRQIELNDPAVRPLYRATEVLRLGAPLLIRRDEMIFATFDGPFFSHGAVRTPQADTPVLLLAPPFQVQGIVALTPGIERTQALRSLSQSFFVVRKARVFDAEGEMLGEGEQIVVNGAMVQMACATDRRIGDARRPAPMPPTVARDALEPAAAPEKKDAKPAMPARAA